MQPMLDDEAVRAAVIELSRPHPSGGRVIERAAVQAAGPGAASIMAWVDEHGHAEALPDARAGGGLHTPRGSGPDMRRPLRYVLPAAVLAPSGV